MQLDPVQQAEATARGGMRKKGFDKGKFKARQGMGKYEGDHLGSSQGRGQGRQGPHPPPPLALDLPTVPLAHLLAICAVRAGVRACVEAIVCSARLPCCRHEAMVMCLMG